MPATHPAHAAAEKARDALLRCRLAEWNDGNASSTGSPNADRHAREVTAAIAELVKLATGVASQPDTHWAEERTA